MNVNTKRLKPQRVNPERAAKKAPKNLFSREGVVYFINKDGEEERCFTEIIVSKC